MLDKNTICHLAADSLIFAGTKYSLHKVVDGHYFQDVNAMDIIAFLVADGVYYVLLRNLTAGYFSSLGMYQSFVMKYGAIIIGVSLIDFLMGRSDRIMSNLINIGLSGGVNKGIMYFSNMYSGGGMMTDKPTEVPI